MLAKIILVTVEVICSLMLIGLILLQQSKSEGLGLAFGAGMGESLFGSRAGNILTKLTVIFAAVFMINTVLLALAFSGESAQSLMSGQMGAPPEASRPITGPGPSAMPPPVTAPATPASSGISLQEIPSEPMAMPVEAPASPPIAEPEPVPAAE